MSRAPAFGKRGLAHDVNLGVRRTASTFGKARFSTGNAKTGTVIVESDAELLVSHLLAIDPRVSTFQPQPFTVDLQDQCILYTPGAVRAARSRHGVGAKFYTPDFLVDWTGAQLDTCEVKFEGFPGDQEYWAKIDQARPILEAYGHPLRTAVVPANARHAIRINAPLLNQAVRHVRGHLTDDIIAQVSAYCSRGSVSQGDLCRDLNMSPNLMPVLLLGGVVRADIAHEPMCMTMKLAAAWGDLSHLYLFEEIEK